MTKTEDYLLFPYEMEVKQDTYEGGCVVSFPDLPGCITCADTLEEAVAAAQDAKAEWIAAALQEGIDIPLPPSHPWLS